MKTFGAEVEVFHVHKELERIDGEVNAFFAARPQAVMIGVGDMPVTDEAGKTVGMVRVVAYRE